MENTTVVFQGAGYDWHRGEATNGIRNFPAEPRVDLADRNSIIRWLAWNDRNGCYTDADCASEGLEPLTLEDAREHLVLAFDGEVTLPDVERMADLLADDIRANVSREDWDIMRGDIERDPLDIRFPIDTNECMVAVWQQVYGRDPDATSDRDSEVWNAVWTAAVARPLRAQY